MLQAYNYDTGAPIAASFDDLPTLLGQLGKYTGPGEKKDGANFNCGATICWPIGKDTEAVWANLQRQLNRFAKKAGFSKIDIDTFIGPKTVAAINAVARETASSSDGVKAVAAAGSGKSAWIAAAIWAEELEREFRAAANAQGLPAASGAIVGVAAGQTRTPGPKPGPGYVPPSLDQKKGIPKAVWWVVGIAALAGIGTIGYMTYKRSKQPASKRKTARVRAPAFAR